MLFADLLSQMKDDPVTPLSGGTTGLHLGSVIQMVAALAIVVLLVRWIVPRILSRWQPKASGSDEGAIRILASATVGTGSVHVVEVEARRFLVGSSPNGFTLLSELGESDDVVQAPTDAFLAGDAKFQEMLERLERLRQ
jgi:flagellar biogenesis protein FliO